ncbi:hypothetical protein DICPUDRAFT_31545 [Dictyostelium purpureum]|uniref:Uncharacterized protein n=1 Tax=Dictyostelium purpureum TaxID=5786 RepID=F0ZHD3_DICPU|nr:uncharacterized protein DICPUDRAFT_31545 [Dictyostelium purpureum]EGC36650.1 hypothetical protein DICPUDRAFT_31545 [Dictyostelium purpureum]|eukprot:XP_003286818.1 hypothetical protein DICPUDRAFT_31545 [Dictyostelium purpureum]
MIIIILIILFYFLEKPTKNCMDNPNCFHHLGQKYFSSDIDTYVIENLINNRIKESNNNKLIQQVEERDISIQPAGLKNLGATCYANSLLQLLFMNREFRKLILEMNNQDNNIESLEKKNEIIDQLRLLFLNMQFNRNKVFDPSEFVNTLELSNSVHQDIQEFFILFIGLIESQIDLINSQLQEQQQSNGEYNFLKRLFQGQCHYITECLKCHGKSKSASSFLEIQVQVEGSSGLEESLKRYFSKETINDYFCKKCNSNNDCSRSIELTRIPPYLNFQLLRYTFDKNTFRKKKIHDSFSFPLELNLSNFLNNDINNNGNNNNNSNNISKIISQGESIKDLSLYYPSDSDSDSEIKSNNSNKSKKSINSNLNNEIKNEELCYQLSGILMHQGVGTSGGHYICHLKDDVSGKWYKFDDETVEEIELKNLGKDGKNGRRKKQEGIISSSTAYMVSYSKKNREVIHLEEDPNNPLKSHKNLSKRLLKRLEEMEDTFVSNKSTFDIEFEKMRLLWKDRIDSYQKLEPHLQVKQDFDFEEDDSDEGTDEYERYAKKQSILDQITNSEYYWIDTEWLKNWIQGHSSPIDNSNLQCPHGFLNPNKLESMKRISSQGWIMLYSEMNGGPSFNQSSVCNECLYFLCSQTKEKANVKNIKDHLISVEKKKIKLADNSNSNDNNNNNQQYYISKNWFNNWKKSSQNQYSEVSPTYDISCPHDGLNLDTKDRLLVQKETWDHLFSKYPNSNVFSSQTAQCILCTEKDDLMLDKINSQVTLSKEVKKEMKDLLALISNKNNKKRPNIKEGEYCVVPKDWLVSWEESVLNPDKINEDEIESNDVNKEEGKEEKEESQENIIKPIDNSEFICKEHSGFIYNLDNASIIKKLNQFSLEENYNNSYYDEDIPFLLIPKTYYSKLENRYRVKDNLTIQVKDGNLLEPLFICYECYLLQKEINQKSKLEYTEQTIFIHKLNEKDNEKDKKYYEFPISFRTPRSFRNEVSPVSCDFTIEQLKLTICSILETSTFQQRLFILQESEDQDPTKSQIIELKDQNKLLSEYKIVPNQIIVMKISDDYSSFIDDSNYTEETGFKGTIFNKDNI